MNTEVNLKPTLDSLFKDLLHPNPNINKEASLKMVLYWPEDALKILIANLRKDEVEIRRKSVKAIADFGQVAILPVIELFEKSKVSFTRVSCVKVLVKIAASLDSKKLPNKLYRLIENALLDESPEMILGVISLLRQLEGKGNTLPYLIRASFDENLLRSLAAVSALSEIKDPIIEKCFDDLLLDPKRDEMVLQSVREAIKIYKK